MIKWITNLFKPKNKRALFEDYKSGNDPTLDKLHGLTFRSSDSGVIVSEDTALGLSAVYCAVKVISEAIGMCKLHLYKRNPDGSRERATANPLYSILHDSFSEELTSQIALETLQSHCLLYGNAYAEIVRDGSGRVTELVPIHPDAVKVEREATGKLAYVVGDIVLKAESVLHVPGLSADGSVGYRFVKLARESLGYALATEKYGNAFWRNGARPGGTLNHPGEVSPTARENLLRSWNYMHSGADNANKTALLEEGITYSEFEGNNEQAQYQEIRTFNISEVARLFNISPTWLHELGRATWGNLNILYGQFYTSTLQPWLSKWQNEITRKCVLPSERGAYYAEFNIDSLFAGDIEQRNKGFIEGLSNGWNSHNDILKILNKPTIEGGDTYYRSAQLMPIEKPVEVASVSPQEVTDTTDLVEASVTPQVTDVQQTALNGAQIASLLAITANVVQNLLTPEAAKAIIKASFPLMDDATINGIVDNLVISQPTTESNGETSDTEQTPNPV